MNKMTRMAAGLALVATLGACGKDAAPTASPAPTTTPVTTTTTTETPSPTTTTTQAGPEAFVAWAKHAPLGDRDPSQVSDDQLLNIGNQGCDVISTQPSFGKAVQAITEGLKDAKVTAGEMDAWLRQSVINLCPQYKGLLP